MLLCSGSTFAQDVIVKKDGSTIVCRVVELNKSEIVYKKWSEPNGSNYVMERSAASAINYENGKKVDLAEAENLYQPGNQNDGTQQYNDRALLAIDAAAHKHISNSKTQKMKTIGWIGGGALFIAGSVFCILYNNSTWSYSNGESGHYNEWALPVGLACLGGSVAWTTGFLVSANKAKQREQLISASSLLQENFRIGNNTSFSAGVDLLKDNMHHNQTVGLGLRYNF